MFFALQPGNENALKPYGAKGSTRVPVKDLKLVDGLTIRIRPSWLVDGDYTFVDECVAACRTAKRKYTLLLMGGEPGAKEAQAQFYERTAKDLAKRYGDDPYLWGVHVTGCSPIGTSEELHWEAITPAVEKQIRRMIDAWTAAFPAKNILLAIGNKDDLGMKRVITYLLSKAKGRAIVKHNAMKASTNLKANHNQLVAWAGTQGSMVGFEMVGSTKEQRFGGTLDKAIQNANQVAKAAKPPVISYLAIYPPDLSKI